MTLTIQFANGPLSADQLNTSSIPVVDATSDIIAPFQGQVIFNNTDDMLYKYESGAWIAFCATGTTLHEARYEQRASGQSVTTSTDTKQKFEAVNTSCPDVTASGTNNTDFLLNRGGLWRVSVGARFLGNAGGGERHIWIMTGTTFVVTNRIAEIALPNVGSAPAAVMASTEVRLFANTSVCCGLWQNSGGSIVMDTGFGGINHIAICWLRP